MTKLYKLTERYMEIERLLDIDPELITQEEIQQSLANIKDEIEEKVSSIGKLVLELKSDIDAVKKEEVRLATRRSGYASKMEWLKGYLLTEMLSTNVLKVKQDIISVVVQNSPPSVELIDLEQLPEEYVRIIPEVKELDRRAIADHFKQTGEIVPGVNMILDKKHVVVR